MSLPKLKLNFDTILLLVTLLLMVLSVAYLAKGFYNLAIAHREGAKDLFERWQEQQYIYRGIYPYDAVEGSALVDPAIGPVRSGGYLPWSFLTGVFFITKISWPATRLYHVLLNFIALILLGLFSYRIGAPWGKLKAWFAVAATLAISSNCTNLNVGQYGLIINAFLMGMFWCLCNRKDAWSGLFLGLAMIKPNISAFYFFILPIRKRIDAMTVFFIYLGFSSLAIWGITKLSPIYMIERIFFQSKYFAAKGNSGVNFVLKLGIEPSQAILLFGLLGMVGVGIIFYFCRSYSLLTLFAIASLIGRVSTYHRTYDNVMLVFLLLALMKLMFSNPQRWNILMFSLVGVSLWLPPSIIDRGNDYLEPLQLLIWSIAGVYLLLQEKQLRTDGQKTEERCIASRL
jgi:hypothetical protein